MIQYGFPFDSRYPEALALDAATRIVRVCSIHSAHLPVLIDDTSISRKSFALSLRQIGDALAVIGREKKKYIGSLSIESPEVIQLSPSSQREDPITKIAPEILIRGRSSAISISVVTASYNDVDYLEQCIDSVLSQNYPRLEYFVLDGGSSDGSLSIIKKYEKYLAFWRSAPDNGHYSAVQEGLLKTSGEIMSWINADDMLLPYTFDLVSDLFRQNSHVDWITGRPCLKTESNSIEILPYTPAYTPEKFIKDGFDDPFIQQEGTFWRRSLWARSGGSLDLRLSLGADVELWTRFFEYACVYTATVPLGVFRKRSGQRSELFRNRYFVECVEVMKKFHAEERKACSPNLNLVLDIPLAN